MFRMLAVLALFAWISLVPASATRAQDDDKSKAILGEWYHETNGMHVDWLVAKKADGAWLVRGQYIKPKTKVILGGFEGKDYKYEDDKLTFTRVWVRKPKSNAKEGGAVTIRSVGNDKIKLSIKELDGSTYSVECPRVAGTATVKKKTDK